MSASIISVQSTQSATIFGEASLTLSGISVQSGDIIVVCAACGNTPAASEFSDSQSNSYTRRVFLNSGTRAAAILTAVASSTGSVNVTYTQGANKNFAVYIVRVTSVNYGNTASNSGSSSSPSAGSISTTSGNAAALIGFIAHTTGSFSAPGTGWTQDFTSTIPSGSRAAGESQIDSIGGQTFTVDATLSGTVNWVAVGIAIEDVGGGSGGAGQTFSQLLVSP